MGSQQQVEDAPGAAPTLFLVELRSAQGAPTDVEAMWRALRHAVLRLRSGGASIRCTGAVVVPGDSRCLCLVEAVDVVHVALARDTAGLGTAAVHEVVPVREWSPTHPADDAPVTGASERSP